jgi:hypothetical protein
MPSTTNLEEEEIVDAPGKVGNTSMPEQLKGPNPWRKMMMMIYIFILWPILPSFGLCLRVILKGYRYIHTLLP